MTRNYLVILLVLTGAILVSCTKSDIEYENQFAESYDAWISFKKASGNTYSYVVASGSWTGTGTETRVVVSEGKVVGRTFIMRRSKNDGTPAFDVLEEWHEDAGEINTHSSGAAPVTLDEVYAKARTEWLMKREGAQTYLETENNGMISICGYRKDNCADDCFVGISITSIEELSGFPL